jgi:hypothetical protein
MGKINLALEKSITISWQPNEIEEKSDLYHVHTYVHT